MKSAVSKSIIALALVFIALFPTAPAYAHWAPSPDPAVQHNYYRAVHYSGKGQFDKAIAEFTKAIKREPENAGLYRARAMSYLDKGDYDSAILDLSRAIEIQPKIPSQYYHRARAYYEKGMCHAAIADCDKSLKLMPKYSPAVALRKQAIKKKSTATENP